VNGAPPALLRFERVSKRFCRRPEFRTRYAAADIRRDLLGIGRRDELRDGEFWALRDVDLELAPGEVLGIIGSPGSGKSTLLGLAAGILVPTTGTVTTRTRNIRRFDPFWILNPSETARANIVAQLAAGGMPPERIPAEVDAIADMADLEGHLDDTVGAFGAAMRGRLGMAIHTRFEADLFIIEDGLGGDRGVREHLLEALRSHAERGGSVLLAVPDPGILQSLCTRVLVLDEGRVVFLGDPLSAITEYNRIAKADGHHALAVPRVAESYPEPSEGVLILAVEATALDGRPPVQGEPVVITTLVETEVPRHAVTVTIEVGSGEWFPLAVIDAPPTDLPAGRSSIACHLATLPLLPGVYDCHVTVCVPGESVPLASSRGGDPYRLRIDGPMVQRRSRGPVVAVDARWDVGRALD